MRRNQNTAPTADSWGFNSTEAAPLPAQHQSRFAELMHDPNTRESAKKYGRRLGGAAIVGATNGALEGAGVVKVREDGTRRIRPAGVVKAALRPTSTGRKAAQGFVKGGATAASKEARAMVDEAAGYAYGRAAAAVSARQGTGYPANALALGTAETPQHSWDNLPEQLFSSTPVTQPGSMPYQWDQAASKAPLPAESEAINTGYSTTDVAPNPWDIPSMPPAGTTAANPWETSPAPYASGNSVVNPFYGPGGTTAPAQNPYAYENPYAVQGATALNQPLAPAYPPQERPW